MFEVENFFIPDEKLEEIVIRKDTRGLTFSDAVYMAHELYRRRKNDQKAPPRVLKAEEVTDPGLYAARVGRTKSWVAFAEDANGKMYCRYLLGGYSPSPTMLKSAKFIGPIQTPEV